MSDDHREILRVNGEFVAALEAMDMERMARCWARRDADVCVHPGWEILSGWPLIRDSFRAIFANTGFMRVVASDVLVDVQGDVARVTFVENIYTVAGTDVVAGRVAATNLLLRTPDGWRVTLHHGSSIAGAETETEDDDEAPDVN